MPLLRPLLPQHPPLCLLLIHVRNISSKPPRLQSLPNSENDSPHKPRLATVTRFHWSFFGILGIIIFLGTTPKWVLYPVLNYIDLDWREKIYKERKLEGVPDAQDDKQFFSECPSPEL